MTVVDENATGVAARRDDALLRVEGVQKYFPITGGGILKRKIGDVKAVESISFDVVPGETLGVVGESGCGKSTAGRTVMKLLDPTGGSIEFDGRDITNLTRKEMVPLRREMQMIFQDPYSSLNPRHTVGSIISAPFKVQGVKPARGVQSEVQDLMARVGLNPEHFNRYPNEFSGGQRQRIGIARAIALRPKLIVCDEPVSALDVSIQAQVVNLLEDLQDEFRLAYIFIAHDLSVVRHISDRIAVMYLGRIMEIADSEKIYQSPLHPYTHALTSAVPLPDPRAERAASASCCRVTCPARSTRRRAACSGPAAPRRRTAALRSSRCSASSPRATSAPATSPRNATSSRPELRHDVDRVCSRARPAGPADRWPKRSLQADDLDLRSAVSRSVGRARISGSAWGGEPNGVPVFGRVADALDGTVQVLVDYTSHASGTGQRAGRYRSRCVGRHRVLRARRGGLRPRSTAPPAHAGVGVVAAGNFSLTAAMAQAAAVLVARYLPEPRDHRLRLRGETGRAQRDRPRACRATRRRSTPTTLDVPVDQTGGHVEARGATVAGTQVHSLRLPSFVVSTEVVFALPDERLVIRHDAGPTPTPYVAGTLLAIRAAAAGHRTGPRSGHPAARSRNGRRIESEHLGRLSRRAPAAASRPAGAAGSRRRPPAASCA